MNYKIGDSVIYRGIYRPWYGKVCIIKHVYNDLMYEIECGIYSIETDQESLEILK
jgi:hypothetical protein